MDVTVRCCYCGKDFIAHSRKAKWCSNKCKDIAFRLKHGVPVNPNTEPYHKICVVCGNSFDTFRDAVVTCSSECAKVTRKGLSRKPLIEKTCVICGKTYLSKDMRRKTCGKADCVKKNKRPKQKHKHMIKMVSRKCVICGNRFDVDYRLNYKTCSKSCSLENERIVRKKRGANRRHDKRIPRDKRIDNITLKKLYRRDKGKCYLCGCVCSWDDWRVSDKGNKYPGDTYPTIEHVVPISKGGFDSWDNVRLACWKCNLKKSDSVLKIEPISKTLAYSEKRLGTQPKKTAQYTLDGKLIKIWDSTADIRRTLGLNDKHIQNICRGDKSKTGNAYGYHWEYIEEGNEKCG